MIYMIQAWIKHLRGDLPLHHFWYDLQNGAVFNARKTCPWYDYLSLVRHEEYYNANNDLLHSKVVWNYQTETFELIEYPAIIGDSNV